MPVAASYILLCLFVGVLGRGRKPLGLSGWFFLSLLLTPLAGALALLIVGTGQPQR